MFITCEGNRDWIALPDGSTAGQCLEALGLLRPDTLAATRDGMPVDLSEPLNRGGVFAALSLADEEGERIYERSLRFVMLLALRRLRPGQRVRIDYSLGRGVRVRLPGCSLSEADLAELRREMQALIAQNLPFTKSRWSRDEAIRYFHEDGQEDKAELLRTRPYDWFQVYSCGGMWEYFYGAMAPGTGCVAVFDLHLLRPDGFVLLLPQEGDPAHPAAYVEQPKHLAAFSQSARWCDILGVNNVADLTRLRDQRELREFIRVNEALHEQALGEIAEQIVKAGRRVVLVAGPSSSGKTTTAGRLAVQLRVLGRHAYRISLDDYYLDRDKIPPEPDGSLDLEQLHALDLPRLQEDMRRLLDGELVMIPRFSFARGAREPEGHPLQLKENELVIFEGIHALNPALVRNIPPSAIHRVFVSALTCLNLDDHNRIRTTDVRLLRRIVRDLRFRATTPEKTLSMWPSVRRGEQKWIFPYQEMADSVFNTALHYELPVLRHFSYQLLQQVPSTDPGWLRANRLMKMLHYIPDISEDILAEIPPLSLLREFIGGCTIDER